MSKKQSPNLDSLAILDDQGRRQTVHPADVEGPRLQSRRRVYYALMLLFFALPWLRMDGDPLLKLDIPRRSFHIFGNIFNGQDGFLLFFLLSGVGFTLIVLSATIGRLFCGWGCPQTVWLEGVFRRIERAIDGPASARRKLEEAPMSLQKFGKRALKFAIFLVISTAIAHTFVAYFTGARELVHYITEGPAGHGFAFTFSMAFTGVLMFDMWWFREQTCLIICPYGRLQSALADEDTLTIAYDKQRGEPNGVRGKEMKEAGGCIDCLRCVQVCPTGIDIRNGLQLECIGCAQCADACDVVMDKIGAPKGLVRTDSHRGLATGQRRFWRPRLLGYAFAGFVGLSVASYFFFTRVPFEANVLRVPGAPFTLDDTGIVTNPLMLLLVNKTAAPLPVTLALSKETPGHEQIDVALPPELLLQPEESRRVPLVLRARRGTFTTGAPLTVVATAGAGDSVFVLKRRTKWMEPTANLRGTATGRAASTGEVEAGELPSAEAEGGPR
jgi:cytochrome c oxidase accessory protein FixG